MSVCANGNVSERNVSAGKTFLFGTDNPAKISHLCMFNDAGGVTAPSAGAKKAVGRGYTRSAPAPTRAPEGVEVAGGNLPGDSAGHDGGEYPDCGAGGVCRSALHQGAHNSPLPTS